MLARLRDSHTQDLIMKLLRQLLPALGAMLATYGYVTDGKWQVTTGLVINTMSLIWMLINNTPAAIAGKANDLTGVNAVVTADTPEGRAIADAVPSATVATANNNPGV